MLVNLNLDKRVVSSLFIQSYESQANLYPLKKKLRNIHSKIIPRVVQGYNFFRLPRLIKLRVPKIYPLRAEIFFDFISLKISYKINEIYRIK